MTSPHSVDTLREHIADALRDAAHRCDGTCGLTERDCYDAHPITWSGMADGTTHIDGSVTAIAATVLDAFQQREQRLVDAHQATIGQLRRSEAAVARVREACDQLHHAAVLADGQPHTERERGIVQAVTRVRAALDQATPTAATQTTGIRGLLEHVGIDTTGRDITVDGRVVDQATARLCGQPHHDYPATLCTEPAGHYRTVYDPHAGPLIVRGREIGAACWDEYAGEGQ